MVDPCTCAEHRIHFQWSFGMCMSRHWMMTRAQNAWEGWNNKFLITVGEKHPTVWKTISWFPKENVTVDTLLEQDALWQPPKKQTKAEYTRLQQRWQSLFNNRISGNKYIPAFLRCIGQNIRLTRMLNLDIKWYIHVYIFMCAMMD